MKKPKKIKTMTTVDISNWLKENNYRPVHTTLQWWYHPENDEWSNNPEGPGWSLGIPVKKVILGEL